jgi:choice-of-anchor A domain-containing protein
MAIGKGMWGAAVFLLAAMPAAMAGTLTAQNILDQFNAVIFNTFTSSADVEGRLVVGQTMTGGASVYINPNNTQASAFSAITVYGNQTGAGSLNVNNGGGVTIGGTNAGGFTLNSGGNVYIGGANTGGVSASSGTISVGGSNTGQLTAGGSVFIGGANSAQVNVQNNGAVSIKGNDNIGGSIGSISTNGGNVTIAGNTGNVTMSGGQLTYTGSKNGSLTLNGGATSAQVGSVSISTPIDPLGNFGATFQNTMTALSSTLTALPPDGKSTAVYNAGSNTVTINAVPNASGTAVLSINTSLFHDNASVTINLNGATSVFIDTNVDTCVGANCSFTFDSSINFLNPTNYADQVVWNFANATGLTFDSMFGGTILAPLATVANNSPIDGSLIAMNFNGGGELHSYAFTGTVPGVSVPEPSALMLFGPGLASIGAWRARRRERPRDGRFVRERGMLDRIV